jgi:hypothetical protein
MIFGHIALILAQTTIVYLYATDINNSNDSKLYKIVSVRYVLTGALDLVVSCLMCGLISEFDF